MKNKRLLTLFVVLTMCIWGLSWSSAKVLSAYGKPIEIGFIRASITLFALIPIMLFMKQTVRVKSKGIFYLIGGGFCMIGYAFLFFKGLSLGLSGIGGVIVTTLSPLFAYVINIAINKKAPNKNEISGIVVGLIAGLVLLQIWDTNQTYFSSGIVYFFLAALVWATMSKFTSKANFYGNVLGFSWWMHVITVVGLFIIVDKENILSILYNGDAKFWVNILYFGIINSAVATTIYFYSTNIIGPEKAGSFMFIVPLGAVLFSWLFLNETLEIHTLIGGTLGILAVLMINGKLTFKQK